MPPNCSLNRHLSSRPVTDDKCLFKGQKQMSVLRKSLIAIPTLYMLYVLKWAVGIDIFPDYHAPKLVKLPAKVAVYGIQQLGFDVALPGQSMATQPQDFESS